MGVLPEPLKAAALNWGVMEVLWVDTADMEEGCPANSPTLSPQKYSHISAIQHSQGLHLLDGKEQRVPSVALYYLEHKYIGGLGTGRVERGQA